MNRTVVHDTFVLDRTYPAPPARVFGAFASAEAKAQWWGEPDAPGSRYELDFRVGGREAAAGALPDGSGGSYTFDALYQDIVEGQRIVYSYEMTIKGRRISVSVATLEFLPEGTGTRLLVTEQGAYLDGLDTSAIREQGTSELLDALARDLAGADA